jgi:hypothetical protein
VQAEIFNVLSSNKPSESIRFVVQSQGNFFNSFPNNGANNFSTRNHPHIAERIIPVPIILYVNVNKCLKGQMDKTRYNNVLTQKSRLACTRK